jgi:AcrR family transcriptional regulator
MTWRRQGAEEMKMDSPVKGRPTKYKSDNILERRERILRVARKMIAESGVAELSVRELCARAGIAQKTLYNAFGSKDHVITLAVQQYTGEFSKSVFYKFPNSTIEGQIERMVKVHSRNTQLRSYTTAIMSVYNSSQSDKELRYAVRAMSANAYRPYIDALVEADALQSNVLPANLIAFITTHTYAILTDWCIGDVADDALVERVCEGFLMFIASSTVGQHKTDAEQWLSDLRNQRPIWTTFRKMAEVGPGELRAAHQKTQQTQSTEDGAEEDGDMAAEAAAKS